MFCLDANPKNADWIKQRVDIPGVDSAEKLREWLRRNGLTVEWFKSLPLYEIAQKRQPWLKDL